MAGVSTAAHWGVLGQTQVSGKSTIVARALAAVGSAKRILLIDPAASAAFDAWPASAQVEWPIPPGVTRWQPPIGSDGKAIGAGVGEQIGRAMRQGNVVIAADEVADWPWLEAAARRGLQRGVAVWWITQYATGAPRYLVSQTGAIWSGAQLRGVDVRVLEDATGVDWSCLPTLPDYVFARWYRGDRAVYVPGATEEATR